MPKQKKHKKCFYCESLLSKHNVEYDHFPIPTKVGGKKTVLICASCHDMKDRFMLEDWPDSWVEKTIDDFPKFSRETRLLLARIIKYDAMRSLPKRHPRPK